MEYNVAFLRKDDNEDRLSALLTFLTKNGFTLKGSVRVEVNGRSYTLRSTMFDGNREITCADGEDNQDLIYICEHKTETQEN
jgi:hypothetical protein